MDGPISKSRMMNTRSWSLDLDFSDQFNGMSNFNWKAETKNNYKTIPELRRYIL